ncbi:hypothetical protein Ae201684P_006170 [Aphanomyces euteiches]|uniref:PX domain-containing protein n=1 Tax=Aphanomyces euteiches TaxID=100861 RepID=A0A6G0XBJ7_9STRA|nr:hypothetical protein Ae201684_006504 [Aphanomyces euteiches]KAH9090764.1 hypothetical protein Ae201684P_006170 [Aphanomyces euteiches]KAH9156189.1 hypothetical protein AeRB84_001909 [Aphanomyces euteiches]
MNKSTLPPEPFASSRVNFLHFIDVMVCATDEHAKGYRKHVNYMIQVNEVGKGHWIVSRRYTQFRLLWRTVLKLYRASTIKETRHNKNHMAQLKSLSTFAFPKKTMKLFFVGIDSTSHHVVRDRIVRFDAYLQELIHFLREFQWGEENRQQNAISSKNATKLCWLIDAFLSVPKNFRNADGECDYLHSHPACRNQDNVHCRDLNLVLHTPTHSMSRRSVSRRHSAPPTKKHKGPRTNSHISQSGGNEAFEHILLPTKAMQLPVVPLRKQKSNSDPVRPSVWLESMRPGASLVECPFSMSFDHDFSTPMLGDSPRDTIILGE